MTLKNKVTLLAAVIGVGLIALGTAWKERTRVEPTDYLTFERVVYSGETLWDVCQKYADYEDIQTIIQRVRDDNGIQNPGMIQPGAKIKIRVKKGRSGTAIRSPLIPQHRNRLRLQNRYRHQPR